eukprot:325683-Chlamydomonas_euryale.AAC.1
MARSNGFKAHQLLHRLTTAIKKAAESLPSSVPPPLLPWPGALHPSFLSAHSSMGTPSWRCRSAVQRHNRRSSPRTLAAPVSRQDMPNALMLLFLLLRSLFDKCRCGV